MNKFSFFPLMIKCSASHRIFNTDQSGVFYKLYLLKRERKKEKKMGISEKNKNFEKKVYDTDRGCGNLISKSQIR